LLIGFPFCLPTRKDLSTRRRTIGGREASAERFTLSTGYSGSVGSELKNIPTREFSPSKRSIYIHTGDGLTGMAAWRTPSEVRRMELNRRASADTQFNPYRKCTHLGTIPLHQSQRHFSGEKEHENYTVWMTSPLSNKSPILYFLVCVRTYLVG